jgi:hypothetical protein
LNLGDGNTTFFHKTIKVRNSSNLVKSLRDEMGNMVQNFNQIKQIAINFYQELLGLRLMLSQELKHIRSLPLFRENFLQLA